MEHNLEDSLAMESIGSMDFEQSGGVVNQEDITLEESEQDDNIPMDLDNIEEQQSLMDKGGEEVIISDFIGEQFGFHEYSVQGDNSSGANITIDANQLNQLNSQSEQVIDLQYVENVAQASTSKPNVITIQAAAPQQRVVKKVQPQTSSYPRQVAIAPKPAPSAPYAIAPKPVALVMNKTASTLAAAKKMQKNVLGNLKGNTVIAIGKQLVMVPGNSAGQKIKLLQTNSSDGNIQVMRCSPDQAQLIKGKPTKFIIQGQTSSEANQPAVLTKLVPVSSSGQARYVMQQKTVPISIGGNKVVLTSPTKQGPKVAAKKQIISIKSQSPKVVKAQVPGNVATKKVVITSNPNQNVILKSATSKANVTGHVVREGNIIQGQRTQIHPINVPGKGIQYIKLVTNQPPAQKTTPKPPPLAIPSKNFVLTDSRGNVIQMTAEKVTSGQPPPLVITGSTTSGSKVTARPQKKFVRIAPIPNRNIAQSTAQPARSSQSLLAPITFSKLEKPKAVSIEEFNEMVAQSNYTLPTAEETSEIHDESVAEETVEQESEELADVKPSLDSLISQAVEGEETVHDMDSMLEVELDYENSPRKQEFAPQDEDTSSMDHESNDAGDRRDQTLIVVPPLAADHSDRDRTAYPDDSNLSMEDTREMTTVVSVEADVLPMPYLSPRAQQSYDEAALMFDGNSKDGPGGMRPRKACNCTKSQCLKLYCDCFANGEFCNNCNCIYCHNNLDNEELRQKAIRACLERNPNAFRPKIGKAKGGGPEIIRRHNKGCNCKRSGCLKNYCECYEAKIACTLMCKCVGCRNIEETLERRRDAVRIRDKMFDSSFRPTLPAGQIKQPCSFMTPEVIEAVSQCMLASVTEGVVDGCARDEPDPVADIIQEFSRCMADIISASHQPL